MTYYPRRPLSELGLSTGKKTRLHRILFGSGLRNGTALLLPYDQGLEHGPRDFFPNPTASDPRHVVRLARDGGFNGVAVQIGLAEKFYWEFAGEVPLILKLNGSTDIPPDADALAPLTASVADAVRLGADAVGYTLSVGSPAQPADLHALSQVRADAIRLGMPLVVWAYPRGTAVEAKGGRQSFYAVDYAARTAAELGADVVTVAFPKPELTADVPEPYAQVPFLPQDAMGHVVRSANRSPVLCSGGNGAGDDAMLDKARMSMEAGATGLVFGPNVWQRTQDESLRLVDRLREMLQKYPSEP
jgi:class I fructose-bisphosphate aldolase